MKVRFVFFKINFFLTIPVEFVVIFDGEIRLSLVVVLLQAVVESSFLIALDNSVRVDE